MSLIDKYRYLVLQLFPHGKAWNRDSTGMLYQIAEGLGVEASRIDEALIQLVEDADPRTTTQLLDEWESLVKIPDECQEKAAAIEDRRRDVLRKLTNRGGASLQFFVDLAEGIGYTVTVNNCFPFRAGVNRAGDRLFGDLWRFWFQVQAADFDLRVFRAGEGRAGDRLRTFRNDELECVIRRSAPAHTKVQFLYGS